MLFLNVVGARPNMMKIAPIVDAMKREPSVDQLLLHTGQHYDERMSDVFFNELGIPEPDLYLGVGSASHAVQTARIMIEFESALQEHRPDAVVVVGDVNSTLACTITSAKLQVPVVHVEAGLRSFDRRMPEEINRIVTDALSTLLFTTSRGANENLLREGIPEEKIAFVGNVMIDTLNKHRRRAENIDVTPALGIEAGQYGLVTLHRPSNVDDPETLSGILDAFLQIQHRLPLVFPIHPRTKTRLAEYGLSERVAAAPHLHLIEAQGYLAFLSLMMRAQVVLTDSGGIQEETTILGVPCLTLRENTERPVTISSGTNRLVGSDPQAILSAVNSILAGATKTGQIPELWDGHAAERIVVTLIERFG